MSAIIGSIAGLDSQVVLAGEYSYSVEIPYTYKSGDQHKVFIPFDAKAPDYEKITSVSWTWTPKHQRYQVLLCNMLWDQCEEISGTRSGMTKRFNYAGASMPFYFLVKAVGRPFNPEWGGKRRYNSEVVITSAVRVTLLALLFLYMCMGSYHPVIRRKSSGIVQL